MKGPPESNPQFVSASEDDFARILDNIFRKNEECAREKQAKIETDYAQRGVYRSSMTFPALEEGITPFHDAGIQEAMRLVADFHRNHGIALDQLLQIVDRQVGNFTEQILDPIRRVGRLTLGGYASSRIAEAETKFRKRTKDAILDLRVGYIGGESVRIPQSITREQTIVMHITHSTIGLLNTGSIEDVRSISVNVSNLAHNGHADVADALKIVTETVASNTEISEKDKEYILDQIEEVSRQATLPFGQRAKSGVVKAILEGLAASLGAAGGLAEV